MLPQRHLHLHTPFRLSFDALVTLTFDSDLLVLFSCNARFSFLPVLFLFFSCSLVIKKLGKLLISSLLLLLLRCCSLANASKSLSGFFGMKIDFFNLPSPLTNGHKPRCSQLGIATPTRISRIGGSSSSRTCCIEGFFRDVCRFWIKVLP
jgi:hypothetical protein